MAIHSLGFSGSPTQPYDSSDSDTKMSSQFTEDLLLSTNSSDTEGLYHTVKVTAHDSQLSGSGDELFSDSKHLPSSNAVIKQVSNSSHCDGNSHNYLQKHASQVSVPSHDCIEIKTTVENDENKNFKNRIFQPIPLVKIQCNSSLTTQAGLNSSNNGNSSDSKNYSDSPDADTVSIASSKLKALSSFDSVRDSEDDLHVTEDDCSSPALSKRKHCEEGNVETEDEGLGATDIEGQPTSSSHASYESIAHTAAKKNKVKNTTQEMSALAASVKTMPARIADITPKNDGNEESRPANGRFRTHPPIKDRVTSENGSVDSNGLGSLRESCEGVHQPGDITSQVSSISSFDSQFCPSEVSTDPQSSDKNLTSPGVKEYGYQDKAKKGSPKSTRGIKSVPSSSSVISKHEKNITCSKGHKQNDKSPTRTLSLLTAELKGSSGNVSTDSQVRVRSRSRSPRPEVKLTGSDDSSSGDENPSKIPVKRPSKKRQRGGSSDRWEPKERIAEKIPKTVTPTSSSPSSPKVSKNLKSKSKTLPSSLPSTPLTSPESTLTRAKSSLTPEVITRKFPTLLRSHSSASVLLNNNSGSQEFSLGRKLLRPKLGESLRFSRSSSASDQKTGSSRVARRSDKSQGQFSPSLEPIYSSCLSLFEGPDKEKKKRDLIVQEFYNSEKQYVEALQVLVERYMIPLKSVQRILDSTMVDEIFYKINEIYMHHATLLAFMERSIADWSDEATIGDVIYKTFCKQTVVESYVSFIENFPRAEKVLDDISSKSAFQKFVEQVEREGRTKLPLKAQIVKPAQRIPRYELLIKRLQEHTPEDHADFKFLKQAEEALHEVALRINSVKQSKKEEDLQGTLKKIELLLLTDLVAAERQYQRHDMVQILNRKDQCCLWLFTDLFIIGTIKRKSGTVSRKSSLLLQSPSGHDFIENTKQRLWLKLSLEDVEIVQDDTLTEEKKPLMDKDQLEMDYKLLGDMGEIAHKLQSDHSHLDHVLRDLIGQVNKQLSEYQLKSPPPEANKIELVTTLTNGMPLNLTVVFPSPDKKISWIALFYEMKQKLSKIRNAKPPEFIQALQITKTRAGMQFSCAAIIEGVNPRGFRDVWVCNSDGYVGHMCLLTLMPEPIVTLNTPVPGCNSRILCICAVPAYQQYLSRHSSCRRRTGVTDPPTIKIQQDSTDLSGEDGYMSDSSTSTTDTDDVEMTDDSTPLNIVNRTDSDRSDKTRSTRSPSPCQSLPSSSSGILSSKEHTLQDPAKSTMWMGTEDGCIHIFLSTENIKTTKNKIKLQHSAAVLCIVAVENSVFVSLANGDLVVYKRDSEGQWDTDGYETISLTTAGSPVNKMIPVAGKMWCASNNDIIVVNPNTLEPEITFTGNPDSKRGIHTMVCSGQAVWVAGNGSSKVFLYHATHYELLLDVSIAQAVAQKLLSADDIIRQHKTACLRITALLTCKDFLWVGTSAGVILTIPMPKVTAMTTKSTVLSPVVTGLNLGHTGHVRFLSCIESPTSLHSHGNKADHHTFSSSQHSSTFKQQQPSKTASPQQKGQQQQRKTSMNLRAFSSRYLVISGGDGFEDFQPSTDSSIEITGKDDSTNHLLLWHV